MWHMPVAAIHLLDRVKSIAARVMHGAEGAAFLELGLMVFALLASQFLLAVIIALNILEAFFIEKHAR